MRKETEMQGKRETAGTYGFSVDEKKTLTSEVCTEQHTHLTGKSCCIMTTTISTENIKVARAWSMKWNS